jgi:diaminopimelate epimerase
MILNFEKFHGSGNDFIMMDTRHQKFKASPDIIAYLCDRHFGIGADGLIMLEEEGGFDFAMRYFNADGRESTMCGNGGRCLAYFAQLLGISKDEMQFHASDGPHRAKILSQKGNTALVKLEMRPVEMNDWVNDSIFLDTGSPHYLIIKDQLDKIDVETLGRKARNDERFAAFGGTNVDFLEEKEGILNIRTYERGVEAETLSCGTGVTAAGLAWAIKNGNASPVEVKTKGGDLKVHFEKTETHFQNIWLEGPAQKVYSGKINIET